MYKILFVCHGNICRSPMAEFVMKNIVSNNGYEDKLIICSAATSTEEIGNDIHPGTRKKLIEQKIPFSKRKARQITYSDYDDFDLLIGMDYENINNMKRRWPNDEEHKIRTLLYFTGSDNDIDDPWYSGNFDKTFNDINEGCNALFTYLKRNKLF